MADNPKAKQSPSAGEWHEAHDPEVYTHTLASIILKNTAISQAQLKQGIVDWREQFYFGKGNQNLADVLAGKGILERMKIQSLLKATDYALKRREDKIFGKRALKKGLITKTQLDEALAFQKQLFKALREVKRLETILMDDGFLKGDAAKEIWAEFDRAKPKKKSAKPATVGRAAKSAGIALEIDDDDVVDGPEDDDDDDVVFAPKSSSTGGSALDLESLKEEQAGTAKAAESGKSFTDEVLGDEAIGEDLGDVQLRPSMAEERDAWAAKRAEADAEKRKNAVVMDEEDFSDDNMNAALDDAIEEIDLSDDFTARDAGGGAKIDDFISDDGANS